LLLHPDVDAGGQELSLLFLRANAGRAPDDNHIVQGTWLVLDRDLRFRGVDDRAPVGTLADDDR
jgi:hypothetical protein